jgi:hypothetical protein
MTHNLLVVCRVESFRFQPLFLSLQSLETLCDIRVDKIGNVLSVHDLGNNVVFP